MSGTVADPRVILQMALMVGACGMVLCHNHPSGSLRPSIQDRELTLKIKEAAKLHDIIVLDHIILSDQGYFSFADEGLL
jgi:DNA repair protein RadC